MSLILPKLDDRDWESLVEEAKRRISTKCANWTDFNPSDPGMMLVELTAWMTETVLYRLNRVPELNYIKFLELVGLRLHPARPARTWVFFQVQKGYQQEGLRPVLKNTRVSTRPQAGQEPVTFITCADLNLTSCDIKKTASRYKLDEHGPDRNEFEEIHNLCGPTPWEAEIFHRAKTIPPRGTAVPHNLYLGDAAIHDFPGHSVLGIMVEVETGNQNQDGLRQAWEVWEGLNLAWEAWDGRTWLAILPASANGSSLEFAKAGKAEVEVEFDCLPALKQSSQAEVSRGLFPAVERAQPETPVPFWLRARLIGSSSEQVRLPKLKSIKWKLGLKGCTEAPRRAFAGTPGAELDIKGYKQMVPPATTPLEINQEFYPLGMKPVAGSTFCLESPLFQKQGATIRIQIELAHGFPLPESARIEVKWEYLSAGQSWQSLGKYEDTTAGFVSSGYVEFCCPENISLNNFGGQSGWFIRARVVSLENTFGAGPVATSVLLGFTNEVRPWATCFSENYSEFNAHHAGDAFTPFQIHPEQDPAFYLCFDGQPSPAGGPIPLFLDVVPQAIEPLEVTAGAGADAREIEAPSASISVQPWRGQAPERLVKPPSVHLQWEYAAPAGWKPLTVLADETEGFVHEGMLRFVSPRDWTSSTEFQQAGFWLRVRWELVEYLRPLRLRRVLLNGVEAEQRVPVLRDRVLGSSDGTSGQTFSLRTSILEGVAVWIRESDQSTEKEARRLEQESQAVVTREHDGCWVQWEEQRNFFRSGPNDRHFTADLDWGTLRFGDGIHGKIPPAASRGENIRAHYELTQGSRGNVGAQTITVMETSLPGVQGVTNFYPAAGGCDRETMEMIKERGPWEIKHGDRAVTTEDFEHLAKKASALVGPAHCYEQNGLICVVIVPNDPGDKPLPNRWLVEEVTRYLEARRLINTRIKVLGPLYESIDVRVDLVLDPLFVARFAEIKSQAETRLRGFVHPVNGLKGSGWPLGRTVHLSELYYRLEDLDGVDHVGALKMARSGTVEWEDNLSIGERSYPCFATVDIRQGFDLPS